MYQKKSNRKTEAVWDELEELCENLLYFVEYAHKDYQKGDFNNAHAAAQTVSEYLRSLDLLQKKLLSAMKEEKGRSRMVSRRVRNTKRTR